MDGAASFERLLRRDRLIVAACLALTIIIAWAWTLQATMSMPPAMDDMSGMTDMADMGAMSAPAPAFGPYLLSAFVMWVLMMIAMMLPSAAPMILLYARVARSAKGQASVLAPTGLFAAVYLAVWSAFALLAALAQTELLRMGVLSAASLKVGDQGLVGGLLILAGFYQLTPLKRACLASCRSPVIFLTRLWRPGWAGAIRLGLAHGLYCVGCCWLLMALLFVGGIMSLAWVAGLAAFVLAEKLLPVGQRFGLILGAAAILAGVAIWTGLIPVA
ncbi:MAG: DUF2182 domain-containing protein [Parvibaculum sp.]|uniref:DUF2182 domain-containing protein n=1 Tax=Parvibaculum sp. TaxID=2024848 RepID=UPI003C737681